MGKFPTDIELEKLKADASVDGMVKLMLSANGPYEGRKKLAEFIANLRGHFITIDNTEVQVGGTKYKCDHCKYNLFVPEMVSTNGGIYGEMAVLNCPEYRKQSNNSAADIPKHLFDKLLVNIK